MVTTRYVQLDITGQPYTRAAAPPKPAKPKLSPVEKPFPNGWKPRKGNFSIETAEDVCRRVRGCLIARLDDCFELGIRPRLTERLAELIKAVLNGSEHGTKKSLEAFVRQTLQEVQVSLFPEEFLEEAEAAAKIRGLVPKARQGLERVSHEAMVKLARKLEQKEYRVSVEE